MANSCYYNFRIRGKAKNVKEFCEHLNQEKEPYIGFRVFEVCVDTDSITEDAINNNDIIIASAEGFCAWNIDAAFEVRNPEEYKEGDEHISLTNACIKYKVDVEAQSTEPGCQITEHFVILPDGDLQEDWEMKYIEYPEYANEDQIAETYDDFVSMYYQDGMKEFITEEDFDDCNEFDDCRIIITDEYVVRDDDFYLKWYFDYEDYFEFEEECPNIAIINT